MLYFAWIIGFALFVIISVAVCSKLDNQGYLDSHQDRP